jgi:hypothetical protein
MTGWRQTIQIPMSQSVFGTNMPHRTQLQSRDGVEKNSILNASELKAIGDTTSDGC